MAETFGTVASAVTHFLEACGIAVIVGGFVVATLTFIITFRERSTHQAYVDYRRRSVRGLILGLEFLVAADIIKTVVVMHALENVLVLGLVILIRSFLVFSLHLEVEGRLFPAAKDDYVEKD